MRRPGSLLFLLFSGLFLTTACGKKKPDPTPSLDNVGFDDGGSIAQVGARGPQVPFRILAVHNQQKPIEVEPWHEAGGDWTFFDAKTTDGYAFGFGFDKPKGSQGGMGMQFGKVMLTVPSREDGKKIVELFSKRFSAPAPAEKTAQPLAFRPFTAVFLASDARKSTTGFSGSGGGYYATKLFLQRPGIEAEVYFNFNLGAKQGEFSEKDSDYAKDMVAFLASELRDGKAPRPSPANNPAMTEKGPRIVMGRALPGRTVGWSPERDRFFMKEPIEGGGAKLVAHALDKEEATEVFRVPDDLGTMQCSVDRCVAESVRHKEKGVESSEDPCSIMVADRKTHAVTKITGPWSPKISLAVGATIAPDGEIVLVEELVPNPGGKTPFKHVLWAVDRKGVAKGPIDLGGEGWQVLSIEPAAKGSTMLIRKRDVFEKNSKPSFVTVDPKTGAVAPASAPATSTDEEEARSVSPNGKKRVACTDGAIVVTEAATKKETGRLPIFDADKKAFEEGCLEWASDRFLLYQTDWIGFLDTETMKVNGAGQKGLEEGHLYFDKKFEHVVHDAGGKVRVGKIETK